MLVDRIADDDGVVDDDSDGDGGADCNDACPDDPNKTEAGVCGCGVSDDDSDKSANAFDADFQALGPKYQGYKFHAIVASALPAFAPCLFLSAARGQEYIDLVSLTGGVFGDLLRLAKYLSAGAWHD